MSLTGKQKRFLRAQAHHLSPIFQIGKGGINEAMSQQIGEALEKRELIKISLLQNTDLEAQEAAEILVGQTKSVLVQVIGHMVVLFKVSSREKYQRISKEVARV